MKYIGKQKISSWNPTSTQAQKKSNFEKRPFTVPAHVAIVQETTTDLSGYRNLCRFDLTGILPSTKKAEAAKNPEASQTLQPKDLLASPQRRFTRDESNARHLLASPKRHFNHRFNGGNNLQATPQENLGQGEIVQTRLTIGEPNDKYEQEADRVAAEVVQELYRPAPVSEAQGEVVQGKESEEERLRMKPMSDLTEQEEEEEEVMLRMKSMPDLTEQEEEEEEEKLLRKPMELRREAIGGGEASPELESAINRARGGGQPLDASLQESMGQAMGADFSGVRVHTDAQADQLNQELQAKAFTTGQDVFFRQGAYQPGSRGGQELIAHELTHVVQQNGGAVQRTPLPIPLLGRFTAPEPNPSRPRPKREKRPEEEELGRKQVQDSMRVKWKADYEPSQSAREDIYRWLVQSDQREADAHDIGGVSAMDGSRPFLQRQLLVRIRTEKGNEGERYIKEVKTSGRTPTTVSGQQGEHTVAASLITQSAVNAVRGKTRDIAAVELYQLGQQSHIAKITAGRSGEYNWKRFCDDIRSVRQMVRDKAEGEDINTKLEDALETYIRLANKRIYTALKKTNRWVSMGGKEKEGKGDLEGLKNSLAMVEFSDEHVNTFAIGVAKQVDFVPQDEDEAEILAEVLVRAIDHGIQVVEDTDLSRHYDILPKPVFEAWQARAKSALLGNKQIDKDIGAYILYLISDSLSSVPELVRTGLMPTYAEEEEWY